MKILEISSRKTKSGKKHFRAVLFKIHPDSCVVDKTGTDYNLNGITWLRKYCEESLPSIKGSSVKVEFVNDERTEILGHGETGIQDGIPVFENATMIGFFDEAHIESMVIDGEECEVCIGSGTLDYMVYKPFIDILQEKLSNGETIFGSVEIIGQPDNDLKLEYLYGWKENGRIPINYQIGGWAILDVLPSDNKSQLLELNKKNEEEQINMDEKELKKLIADTITETNSKNEELTAKISELNSQLIEKEKTVTELNASVEQLNKALTDLQKQQETSWAEREILEKELAKAKVAERLAELDKELGEFNEAEKEFAKDDIDKLKETINACEKKEELNSIAAEINSIKAKICTEIVAKQKKEEAEAKIAEINSAKEQELKPDDILSDMIEINSDESFDLLA